VERDAEDYVRRIDEMGGALAAVERGFQAQEIHENAFRIQRAVEARRKIVVGVNEFVDEERPPDGLHQHDLTVGERRTAPMRRLRAGRDGAAAQAPLRRLEVAREHAPALIECRGHVTPSASADARRSVKRERSALAANRVQPMVARRYPALAVSGSRADTR
jgi:methylmalonyl-CoA mutase N-terminal domain/subunit